MRTAGPGTTDAPVKPIARAVRPGSDHVFLSFSSASDWIGFLSML